jgi:cold shock protein
MPKPPHHPIGQPHKIIGHVKWFSEARGYGFLTGPQHPEVFVHFSAIQVPGHKTLSEGQRVVFRVGENEKGQTIALDVVPVKDPNAPDPVETATAPERDEG